MIVTETGEKVFYVQCTRTGCARPDWPLAVDEGQAKAQLRADGWSEDGVCPSCQATDGVPAAVLAADAAHGCEVGPEPFDRGGL